MMNRWTTHTHNKGDHRTVDDVTFTVPMDTDHALNVYRDDESHTVRLRFTVSGPNNSETVTVVLPMDEARALTASLTSIMLGRASGANIPYPADPKRWR